MNPAVDSLAERAIREHWEFLPTAGSRIGLHEYDGRLPDFSAGRIRRRVEELHQTLAQLSALPADPEPNGSTDRDDRMDRLNRSLLELFLRRELFNLEEMRTLETQSPAAGGIHRRGQLRATRLCAPARPFALRNGCVATGPRLPGDTGLTNRAGVGGAGARHGRARLPGHGVVL